MRTLPSLRQRVLVLFALLAVCPVLALGVLDYARGRRAVERIVGEQTDAAAAEAARLVAQRLALSQSDALLLGENDETRAWLDAVRRDDAFARDAARRAVDDFALLFWSSAQRLYFGAEVHAADGRTVLRIPADGPGDRAAVRDLVPLTYPITAADGVTASGRVVLHPRRDALIPSTLPSLAFGRTGFVQLVDATTTSVLYSSNERGPALQPSPYPATAIAASRTSRAPVRVMQDSARVASVMAIEGSRWAVMASTSLEEFTGGLDDARVRDLTLLIAATLALAALFTVLVGRSTRSLEALTHAARAAAAGDLRPALPVATDDEVGTLTQAFAHMLERLDGMVREIEVSRQLAVLGEFSAQLSHEIRNPLTSIKLNLQELSRDVKRGHLPTRAAVPLDTCLSEVQRLDGVVRGVLALTRAGSANREPVRVHALLERVCTLHDPALRAQGIHVTRDLSTTSDTILGDDAQLVSLFGNLLLNAAQAQPHGGRVHVHTTIEDEVLSVWMADNGPGIPAEMADRIFRPFVSGSPTGTGIGLSLALTIARHHGGSIALHTPSANTTGGAFFRVTLPMAATAHPSAS